MSKIKKQDNRIARADDSVIKVNLASRGFSIHLGPFMPFNSGGFAVHSMNSDNIIRTNTTIKIAAPKV